MNNESEVVACLRKGEEVAFVALVQKHHGSLLRVAKGYLRKEDLAEEVVQETWLAVVKGIDCFEGRSSLRTWIFSILANIARKRRAKEARAAPFAELIPAKAGVGRDGPAGALERKLETGERALWTSGANCEARSPERHALAREALAMLSEVVGLLPELQRVVITLRDIEGWTGKEVCELLTITPTYQRVLLHRARAVVRAKLSNCI